MLSVQTIDDAHRSMLGGSVAGVAPKGTVTCDCFKSLDCLAILAYYLATALGSIKLCCLDFIATMAVLTAASVLILRPGLSAFLITPDPVSRSQVFGVVKPVSPSGS